MSLTIRRIVMNAAVAALYVVLTLVSAPFAFLDIQFRISEMLMLLCFFRKDYTVGLTIGCLIANVLLSPIAVDFLLGTLATLLACLAMCFCKHMVVAMFMPVITNGIIVGLELTYFYQLPTSLLHNMVFVAIGELAVMAVGYVISIFIFKRKKMLEFFQANQNLDWKF